MSKHPVESALDESSSSMNCELRSDLMSCQKESQQIGLPHSDDWLVSGNGARKVESCSSDLDEDENSIAAENPISSPVVLGKYGRLTLVKKNAVFPKVQSVLPCDAFSASAKETEFVDFSCNNDAGSSSTENNVRRTGDENDFFEPPAPGMQSTINIIDKSQLGQGSASTEDSNEDLLDSLFLKSTNECMEKPTEESASTVERKKFLREAAIDLNRQLYHSYMSLIRVLEESLRVNLEKQMQLSTSIEFLKLTGTKKEPEKNRAQRPPEIVLDSDFMESLALEGVGIQMPVKKHWLDYEYS